MAVASVSSANCPIGMIPALLMRTSSGPSRFSTSSRNAAKLVAVRDVERQADRARAQLLGGALGQRGVDVADRDARSLRDQRRRGGATDAPGTTGDCDDLARERSWGFRHETVLLMSGSFYRGRYRLPLAAASWLAGRFSGDPRTSPGLLRVLGMSWRRNQSFSAGSGDGLIAGTRRICSVSMASFRYDGQRLAYTMHGEGPRIHGADAGPAAVAEDADAAGARPGPRRGSRVITFDPLGHGESDRPARDVALLDLRRSPADRGAARPPRSSTRR